MFFFSPSCSVEEGALMPMEISETCMRKATKHENMNRQHLKSTIASHNVRLYFSKPDLYRYAAKTNSFHSANPFNDTQKERTIG